MAIEMLTNNKINKKNRIEFTFFKNKICNCVHYWRIYMDKFSIFSFGQIMNEIWMIKFEVLCNVQMKYGLNKMKIRLCTRQLGWLDGKRVEFHLWV